GPTARPKSFPAARRTRRWCCARERGNQTRRQGDKETRRQGVAAMTTGRSETPRRWRILLVSLSPCLLVLIAAWWFWHRERVPEPPEVNLTGVDAAVVAAVEVAREKV